jgi:cupin superfamily acireductone dioxygenase involved in methionine salvage
MRETDRGRGIFSLVDHKKDASVAAFVGDLITIPTSATEEEADPFGRTT